MHHTRSRGLRPGLAIGLCGVLLAAGCGTRWSNRQEAEMSARYAAARSSGSASGSGGAASAVGSTDAGAAGAGTTGVTAGGGSTGASSATGGSGSAATGGVAAGSTSAPCAAPSTAPGVSSSTITIGTVTTLSGPIPGLGTSSLAGVQAYVAYLNSLGGVCGRKVALKSADDGGDNAQARAQTAALEPQVLGLIGGVAGGVAGSQDLFAQKRIPAIETAVAQSFMTSVPSVFGTDPPFPSLNTVIGKFKYLHDQGVRKAAIVYVNAQSAPEEVNLRQKPLMEAAGINVVLVDPLPLTTLSYDSAARAVANSGADYLFFLHEAGASAAMARAVADSGYHLKFAEYLTAYGSNFIDLAGSASENAISWIRSLPNEDRGQNAVLDAYLTWMQRAAPGASVDNFAADSWVAAKAFFDALQQLKGPITRDAVTAQLAATGTYDAGGFFGPIQLGKKRTQGCQVAMIVKHGTWQRLTPSNGFLC